MKFHSSKLLGMSLASLVLGSSAQAVTSIQVQMTSGGQVGFAPLFGAFHSGGYDVFDPGSAASAGLETLAEIGSPAGLVGSVPAGVNAMPVFGNNPAPPIFTVGGAGSAVFTVDDGNTSFNYASMVLPSNDWFIGNGTATDVSSLLNAPLGTSLTINVTTLWDAGTEAEDFAFSPGNGLLGVTIAGSGDADVGTDTPGGVVTQVTAANPFATFANSAGFNSGGADAASFAFSGNLATITLTVVPEPSTSLLGALAGGFMLLHRRRK